MNLTAEQPAEYEATRQAAVGLLDRAEAEKRELSDGEKATMTELLTKCQSITAGQKADGEGGHSGELGQGETELLLRQLGMFEAGRQGYLTGGDKQGARQGVKVWDPSEGEHPWTKSLRAFAEASGQKAGLSLPSGSVPLVQLAQAPVALGQPATEVLDHVGIVPWPGTGGVGPGPVVPGVSTSGAFGKSLAYLRQVSRDNRAAVWHRGTGQGGEDEAKPESSFDLEEMTCDAQIVAHYVPEIPKEWLSDWSQLDQFMANEMVVGIRQAVEEAICNASEDVEGIPGLTTLDGTMPISFDTDKATTISHAITGLRSLGYAAGVVAVLSPEDAEEIALMRTTLGEFIFPSAPSGGGAPSTSACPG